MAELEITSEITGTVWKIVTEIGAAVEEDDDLMILESMKMEIPLSAPEDGTVKRIEVNEGDAITDGQIVLVLEI